MAYNLNQYFYFGGSTDQACPQFGSFTGQSPYAGGGSVVQLHPSFSVSTEALRELASRNSINFGSVKVSVMTALPPGGIPSGVWATGAPLQWELGIEGKSCVVGVIDSGIDSNHPDLAASILGVKDYIGDGATPSEYNPHGTHVAGTIAANGKIKGVAPKARLRDYRVLDKDGSGTYAAITQAIRDAADDGCNVVCMSLGGPTYYQPMRDAIRYANQKGMLVVAAAGNSGPRTINYPGYYSEVLGVGAVEFNWANGTITPTDFTSTNREVDIAADGFKVFSTIPDGKYAEFDGTSMAAPHVTGFAALIYDKYKQNFGNQILTEDEFYKLVKMATVDVSKVGVDHATGAGFATFYPEIPKRSNVRARWELPLMNRSAGLVSTASGATAP